MPKKPLHALVPAELSKFGVPSTSQLRQPAGVSKTISQIIATDEAVTAFHHKMVRVGICFRYAFALAVAADKDAFAAFQRDKRIKALARPPRSPGDTLRSLLNATYGDPKKASKYFKRIETLWEKRRAVKAVESFLEKKGLSDPPLKVLPASFPGAGSQKFSIAEHDNTGYKEPAARHGEHSGKHSKVAAMEELPAGSITLWPGEAKVGRKYKLAVKVYAYDGETAFIELIEDPEQLK